MRICQSHFMLRYYLCILCKLYAPSLHMLLGIFNNEVLFNMLVYVYAWWTGYYAFLAEARVHTYIATSAGSLWGCGQGERDFGSEPSTCEVQCGCTFMRNASSL